MRDPKLYIKLSNPWHLLATGFGSGLSPVVPGTVGTLASVPLYYLLAQLPYAAYIGITLAAAVIGVLICRNTAQDMGVHDHGSIVWDEFVGFWITMAIAPPVSLPWVVSGFILFRFFDMVKPWPISWLDKNVHGGLGIMIDDILAGFMAMITLWGVGHWMGW